MSGCPCPPAFDVRIPFYDRTPENRATRAACVKFLDAVGTHLICPRRACRREGGCADRDMAALPLCWHLHRGMLRFLLCVLARRRGLDGHGPAREDVCPPRPGGGRPLLAAWADRGAPIAALVRSVEDGPANWDWETSPEMRAHFARMTG
jgi:hypothetical protein